MSLIKILLRPLIGSENIVLLHKEPSLNSHSLRAELLNGLSLFTQAKVMNHHAIRGRGGDFALILDPSFVFLLLLLLYLQTVDHLLRQADLSSLANLDPSC